MSNAQPYKTGGSFVVDCFNDFYKKVIMYKGHVLSQSWQDLTPDGSPQSPDVIAEYILSRLQLLLEQQAVQASYGGTDFAQSFYAEAQFIMAALADEIFLSLNWDGKKYWESHILEQRLFNTHSAGQVFFERLENLLQVRDPVRSTIATLYMYALGLGFRGKFRGRDDDGIINNYLERLYAFINRRTPSLFETDEPLFPETENALIQSNAPKEMPDARNWHLVFLCIGLLYLLASYAIWYASTDDLSVVIDRVFQHSKQLK